MEEWTCTKYLAYLYADTGEKIDEALNLAQSAKEQFPDDPHVSDTLW